MQRHTTSVATRPTTSTTSSSGSSMTSCHPGTGPRTANSFIHNPLVRASEESIGFDLDMTLVDTRPGIHAALLALAADTGCDVDADAIVATLGPPVATALAPYFPADEIDDAITVFRTHMAR